MKKILCLVLSLATVWSVYLFLPSFKYEYKERFENYRNDFSVVTDFIISNIDEYGTLVPTEDEKTGGMARFYNRETIIPEDVTESLERIDGVFKTELCMISFDENRISYHGTDGESYILSLDGHMPNYALKQGDCLFFPPYSLGESWYYVLQTGR